MQQLHKFVCNVSSIRVDKFLADNLTYFSRTKIKKCINSGNLCVNDIQIKDASFVLKEFDVVEFTAEEIKPVEIKSKNLDIQVVYEDDYLLVIDKPSGLTVHPGAGTKDDTLVSGLIFAYKDNLSSMAGELRPGIVHRLDKNTSGLLIIAKNDVVHAMLSEMLAKREISRIYHAIVYGKFEKSYGKIETKIARAQNNRTMMAVSTQNGKHAVTNYRLIKPFKDGSVNLIECKLETGRTHQIRVHMSYLKHPIVGDHLYKNKLNFNLNAFSDDARNFINTFNRQALHAYNLKFIHPILHNQIDLISNYQKDMKELLDVLERD